MGLWDEFKKIARPYDDEDDDFIEDDEPAVPVRQTTHQRPSAVADEPVSRPRSAASSGFGASSGSYGTSSATTSTVRGNKVVNIAATTQVQVVLVRPERFETAAEIADHLREKRTVVLNLEQTNKDVARRLVDFLGGVAYALDGKIKKVANNTFLITPYNVDIMGDLIDELESSGLYF